MLLANLTSLEAGAEALLQVRGWRLRARRWRAIAGSSRQWQAVAGGGRKEQAESGSSRLSSAQAVERAAAAVAREGKAMFPHGAEDWHTRGHASRARIDHAGCAGACLPPACPLGAGGAGRGGGTECGNAPQALPAASGLWSIRCVRGFGSAAATASPQAGSIAGLRHAAWCQVRDRQRAPANDVLCVVSLRCLQMRLSTLPPCCPMSHASLPAGACCSSRGAGCCRRWRRRWAGLPSPVLEMHVWEC
jgi:hypothetical protein